MEFNQTNLPQHSTPRSDNHWQVIGKSERSTNAWETPTRRGAWTRNQQEELSQNT
jgi:hypothetical protein